MAKFQSSMGDLSRRSAGVLLHVTSLPGRYGIGDLGPDARRWIDMLSGAGLRWWQILPLGPTGPGNSPYRCFSAFAGNPLLISPDLLIEDSLLSKADLHGMTLPAGDVKFAPVIQNKLSLLHLAHEHFVRRGKHRLQGAYERFVATESAWLKDFALFMSLSDADPSKPWILWPKPIVRRNPSALSEARRELAEPIRFHQFVQFIFSRQLAALRDHARNAGVALIGDLPIFVSPESSDVWTNPKLFQLDRLLRPRFVSGVPPDMFSADGQRWGNPLYNWTEMKKDGFAWWKARLKTALSQADLVRIDHFRGFESYWSIPANLPTAKKGRWVKAPGVELFQALLGKDANLPLVAEDLGIITPEVEDLRDRFHLPGMRVLQFGLGGDAHGLHLPHNFIKHCFAFTGTHDNDTSAGWFASLPAAAKRRVEAYSPELPWRTEPSWSLIRLLIASVAANVVIPLQDLLELDHRSRMNLPGSSHGNWRWRLDSFNHCKSALQRLARLNQIYGR